MKARVIFGALYASAATVLAGPITVPPLHAAAPANPLSFFDQRLTFEVQERVRWEIRENTYDFNDNVRALTDDNWILNRFRLGVTLKATSWLKLYAQVQDAREYLSDRPDIPSQLGAEGDDAADLRQGYVEIGDVKKFPLSLRAGRQVLEYGDGRLIGPGEFGNLSRSFDAVKLRWQEKSWSVDAFASTVAIIDRGSYNETDFFNGNENDRQQVFSGVYFSTIAIPVETIDLYVLHLHENANARFAQNQLGDTNFFTAGLRIKSKPGAFAPRAAEVQGKGPTNRGSTVPDQSAAPSPVRPIGWDYEFEGAVQRGDLRGLDLGAFAIHVGSGYTFDAAWLPHIGLEYNFGTGDSDPTDRDSETFQNLFPSNHNPYGILDVFSWQNMHDAAFIGKIQPCKPVWVQAEFHAFWLASTDDVWYRSNGSTAVRELNAAAREASNYAGSEADLVVNWNVRKELTLQAGYAHFFAGDYLGDTGAQDDADFGYLQATLSF